MWGALRTLEGGLGIGMSAVVSQMRCSSSSTIVGSISEQGNRKCSGQTCCNEVVGKAGEEWRYHCSGR